MRADFRYAGVLVLSRTENAYRKPHVLPPGTPEPHVRKPRHPERSRRSSQPPMVGGRGAVRQPRRHRDRHHDPQRCAPHDRARPTRRPPICSGSSTPTCSCSRACSSPQEPRRSFGRRALSVGLAIFGAATRRRSPTTPPRSPWRERQGIGGAHHAGDAVDHHQHVHRRPRARAIGVWAGVSAIGIANRFDPRRFSSSTSGGLGVPGQRADLRRRAGVRALHGADVEGSGRTAARPDRRGALDRRPVRSAVGDHRRTWTRAGEPAVLGAILGQR